MPWAETRPLPLVEAVAAAALADADAEDFPAAVAAAAAEVTNLVAEETEEAEDGMDMLMLIEPEALPVALAEEAPAGPWPVM